MSIIQKTPGALDDHLKKLAIVGNKVVASAIIENDVSVMGQLQVMSQTLANLQECVKKEFANSDAKKELVNGLSVMFNRTSSIMDLASANELSQEEAKKYVTKNSARIQRVQELIASLYLERSKKANEEATKKASGETEESNFHNPSKQGDSVLKLINQSEGIIQHYQKYAMEMPQTAADSDKEYILKRVPLVVMTDPIITTKEWKACGIQAKSIGTYSIIEDQLVVGVNANKVKEKRMEPDAYRKFIIESISEKKGNQIVMGKPFGYKNSGYSYVWLVPEKVVDHIRSITHKSPNVKDVGFAFK